MGDFDGLVRDANGFFAALRANNTRDWFQAHKSDYEAAVKAPGALLSDVIREDLDRARGVTHTAKIFRINRDVRFSKDKSPYNTHLHLLWSPPGEEAPGFFLGISPDYVSVGAGMMGFSKEGLEGYRRAVDGASGAALAETIAALTEGGCRIDEPALKRVPKPFDKDHPREALLRRKGLVLWADIADRADTELRAATLEAFSRFDPLVVWLSENV